MGVEPERYFSITWRKSRHSADQGACIEVASLRCSVLVRDSRECSGMVIELTPAQWQELLARVRRGDLDCR
jgi:Domain of unknown function (DUF397)